MNAIVKKYALEGALVEQIRYSMSNELVSSDIVGTLEPAIFDSHATIVSKEGDHAILYVWYDNEYGYSHQVMGWRNIFQGETVCLLLIHQDFLLLGMRLY